MDMSPIHQVWQKPSCKTQSKEEEDKADRKRGGKTTSGNGQAWSSPSPRGQCNEEQKRKKERKKKGGEETGCEVICGAPVTAHDQGIGGGEDHKSAEKLGYCLLFPHFS